MKSSLAYLCGAIFFLFVMEWAFTGCANIIPPEGGPRDTLAPVLIEASPQDSARNFSSRTITFEFDEYVELNDLNSNLIVSPVPAIMPEVNTRLRTVTVRLRDTLEPNTTYVLDFGSAIRDINEGNPYRNFRYTFSTGSIIDSLTFSGQVLMAASGETDSTLIVMLHQNLDDSAVVNERPRYITRLNSQGRFTFRNLPAGTFAVYALKDEGNSRRYLSPTQAFGFLDDAVTIAAGTEPVTIYAYSEPAPPRSVSRPTPEADGRLRLTTSLQNNRQELTDSLVLRFELPITSLRRELVSLHTDSTFTPVNDIELIQDSTRRELVLAHPWKESTQYHLILGKEFATDSLGRQLLKTDTLSFSTRAIADYGNLTVILRNLDLSLNPVLQILKNEAIVETVAMSTEEARLYMFQPGDYDLRILFDTNGNGQWDPGDFFNGRRQPELVVPLNRKITVKANWENQFEITL